MRRNQFVGCADIVVPYASTNPESTIRGPHFTADAAHSFSSIKNNFRMLFNRRERRFDLRNAIQKIRLSGANRFGFIKGEIRKNLILSIRSKQMHSMGYRLKRVAEIRSEGHKTFHFS